MKNYILKYKYSFIAIAIVLGFAVDRNVINKSWNSTESVIEWDVKSYYAYLPATFIYNDLSFEFVYAEENKELRKEIWPLPLENGKKIIITSTGMSYMYLPFFALAHLSAEPLGYKANGYTAPYRFAIIWGAFIYLFIGLFFLHKLLILFFNRYAVALTILAVGIGTNLHHYATNEPGMSHLYNFSLITVFIYQVVQWYKDKKLYRLIIFSILGGLITLIRPTNILIYLVLFLWDIRTLTDLKDRILFFIKNYKYTILIALLFFVFWIPQFMYWKSQTGQFMFYSYGVKESKFFFLNPQYFNILFSYRKGWFIYTPIMFIAVLGLIPLIKNKRGMGLPISIYLVIAIYVLSSWWSWWYGGSYGNRAFVDMYAIMAIPFAYITEYFIKKPYIRYGFIALILTLMWHNFFQMRQFKSGALHFLGMTKDMYWETFLKARPTVEYYKMTRIPDYTKARKGIYEEVIPDNIKEKFFSEKKAETKQVTGIQSTGPNQQYIEVLTKRLKENERFMTSLKAKANKNNKTVEDLLRSDILWLIKNNESMIKENKIYNKMNDLKKQARMMKYIKEKAQKRNISVDSMLYIDAQWAVNKEINN